jgi:nucleoside-triphosphatase THEP1
VLKDILEQKSFQIGGFVIVYIENAGLHVCFTLVES